MPTDESQTNPPNLPEGDIGHGAEIDPTGPAQGGSHSLVGSTVGRYQITHELGGGGMGIVYRAHDTRLDRTVALKFLPPFLSHDSQARSRFFAEARAASALDHPNVCTIHEIGETDDGRIFIAMAAYKGETLKKKIAAGPIAIEKALDYAIQAARGLAKAHEHGIVHRDVKPANLMVTADGVVKVLDFGTAKTRDLGMTQTGTSVGTIAYMSPEQAEGEPVDARTDLWALGVVLYEMLTGKPPFKGERAVAVIYSILCEEPTPPVGPDGPIPPSLSALIAKCLAKTPDDRYASAQELIDDLHAVAEQSGARLPRDFRRKARPGGRSKRSWMWAIGTAIAIGSGAFVLRNTTWGERSVPTLAARQYVAVLPFRATDPQDEVLASGLARSLTSMVARLEAVTDSVWVVPSSAIDGLAEQTPNEVRRLYPVTGVLTGVVERVADATRVTLQLEGGDSSAPRLIGSATLAGPPDTAFQTGIQGALVQVLRLADNPVAQQAIRGEASAVPAAYPYYLQGVGYLRRIYDEGSLENAITLFEQALTEDPGYAPALAGLCEATWESFRRTQQVAVAETALGYCDEAAVLADDEPVVLVTLAGIYLQTGESAKADQAITRALEVDPNNADAYRWLGRIHDQRGEIEEALVAFEAAISLRPDVWLYREEPGISLIYLDRHEEAAAYFDWMIRLSPDNYRGYSNLGFSRLQLGDKAEAERLFRRSLELRPNVVAYRNLGYLYLREGDSDRALTEFESALALNPDDWRALNWKGQTLLLRGDQAEGERTIRAAIAILSEVLEVTPDQSDLLASMAGMQAFLGDEAAARRYLNQLATLPQGWNYVSHWTGRAYELIGERDRALELIGRALGNGYNPSIVAEDDWLTELRTDPRYEALIRSP